MRALTVRQPWCHAIFELGKDIENRDWFSDIRGDVAIHAAKSMRRSELTEARDFVQCAIGLEVAHAMPAPADRKFYTLGAIVGVVEIVGCVREQATKSPWFTGKYGFVLRNPRKLLTPISMSGQLGFWDVPEDVLGEIYQQIGVKGLKEFLPANHAKGRE